MFIPEAAAANFLDSTPVLDGDLKDFDTRLKEAWDDFTYRRRSDSRQRNIADAMDGYLDDVHRATGQRVTAPNKWDAASLDSALAAGKTQQQWMAERWATFDKEIDTLATQYPAMPVKRRADMLADISTEAKRRKAALESGTDVGWAGLGKFLGEAGGAMSDPINIMSMLLTGGWGATAPVGAGGRALAVHFGKSAAINAGIGAATEAAIQPSVLRYNRDLGIDYTLREAVESVAGAAVGGAVLGTGIEAVLRGGGSLWRRWDKARASGRIPDTPEAMALDARLGDSAMVDDANPFGMAGMAGDVAHADATAKATADMMAGRPVDVDAITAEARALERAWHEVDFAPVGLADDPVVAIRPADIEAALDEVLVERGPVFERVGADGDPDIPGQIVVQAKGMRGWGIVKFIFRHGPKSGEPPALQVGKEHLMMFPRIIRELEPEPFPKDNPNRWEWRLTEDHPEFGPRQIVWAVSRHTETDDKTRLVTMYVQQPGKAGAGKLDSVRRAGAPGSPSEVVSPIRDTAADFSLSIGRSQDAPASSSIAPGAVSSKVSGLRERVDGLNQRLAAVESELRRREGLGEPAPLDDPLRAERAALRADIAKTTRAAEKAPLPPLLRPPARKPWRLAYWLSRQGGLREDGGELAARDAAKAVPGLLNNKGGMDFDTAALRAWEAGFFTGDERPTVNEFMDLLDHDLRTKRVYSHHDDDLAAAWDAHEQLRQEVDQFGIDARGMSDEELISTLHGAGVQQAERSARALDWEASKASADLDAAVMKDARRLLDDIGDMDLPVEVAELDGAPAARTRSARELLDEADAELQGLDEFRSCVLGG